VTISRPVHRLNANAGLLAGEIDSIHTLCTPATCSINQSALICGLVRLR
jgi:hypothetical protein